MRPVYQTIFGNKEGNCLAACIASILEVDIDRVPNFHGKDWAQQWCEWLRPHGLFMWRIDVAEGIVIPPGYSILSGQSPRAEALGETWLHATVAFDGETVHDPHPDGGGVLSKSDYLFFQILHPHVALTMEMGDDCI